MKWARPNSHPRHNAARIVGAAWCLPLLATAPLFSQDAYSYLAQGTLVHLGIDPYRHAPAALAQAGQAHYAAAKAGVNQLTATLAAELAPRRIRVNAVAPGPIPTEVLMEAFNLTDEQLPAIAATVPLGRMGDPEDIAAAVVYLASPASSWVTGQVLTVSGGL